MLTENIDILRTAVAKTRAKMSFHIDAWVVLPDHLHAVWTLPEGDTNFSARWQGIKTEFSKQIAPGEQRSESRAAKRERGLWQRRFWEHTIRDEKDYATHIDYVHLNPVKHGLAPTAADWPHSSFHQAVKAGRYPAAWTNLKQPSRSQFVQLYGSPSKQCRICLQKSSQCLKSSHQNQSLCRQNRHSSQIVRKNIQ